MPDGPIRSIIRALKPDRTTCAHCGAPVPAGTGYAITLLTFCNEEHAAEYQQMPPM